MKKNDTLMLLLMVLFLSTSMSAQRFLTPTFDEVQVTEDIIYGVNGTVLQLPTAGEVVPEELKLDLYEPVGDNLEARPLVIVFHTGNFLPNVTNGGITGTKRDSAVVEICTRLAKLGYVAAAADYRLGWNPLAGSQPERALGLIQAAYRGIQDGRTAIRFFKTPGASQYNIDPNRITCWGNGTGAYLTLGLNSLDEYSEILMTTNGAAKFFLDTDGDGAPDTPMVVEAYHGDIEGKVTTVVPADGFGLMAGDTTNYANHVDESSDFALSLTIGGALGDISWMDEGENPIISFQSAYDFFAPYGDAVLIVPTTMEPIVRVQGASIYQPAQDAFGNNQSFKDASISDVYTTQAMTNSGFAGHAYFEGLYPVTNPPNAAGLDEGVIIDWWDPNAPAPGAGMGIPWNQLPHPSGGTFHQVAQTFNMNMSKEKAIPMIDTIFGYFAPRAYAELNLMAVGTENIVAQEVGLDLYPNPASSELVFTSDIENPIQNIQVFDMAGKIVTQELSVNTNSYTLPRRNITSGMHIIMVQFEKGIVSRKVVFE